MRAHCSRQEGWAASVGWSVPQGGIGPSAACEGSAVQGLDAGLGAGAGAGAGDGTWSELASLVSGPVSSWVSVW